MDRLQLSRTIVTGIIILVVFLSLVAGLHSLAYPSVQITVLDTETVYGTNSFAYLGTMFTAILAPYSTTKTMNSYYYEPGNFPGCDPIAMGCNYGFPNYAYYVYSTSTYSKLSTSFYRTIMTTQSTFTSELTKTNTQNIPMYAALGLNDSQFIILSVLTLLLAAILVMLLTTKQVRRSGKSNLAYTCVKCDGELIPKDNFCPNCGAPAQDPRP